MLFDMISPVKKRIAGERNQRLIEYAMPEMARLSRAFGADVWTLACLDADGFVICSIGDPRGPCRDLERLFRTGVSLSESSIGTSAPGCALVEQTPFMVNANEHFLDEIQAFSCAAVPLYGIDGTVVGVLNASSPRGLNLAPVCEALKVAARSIEHQALLDLPKAVHVSMHYHPDMVRTPLAAMLAFSEDGELLGSSQAARKLLGSPCGPLVAFDNLFDLSFAQTVDRLNDDNADLVAAATQSGILVHMSLTRPLARKLPTVAKPKMGRQLPPVDGPLRHRSKMICSDPILLNAVADAKLAFSRDIPILLTGETGTGKELLARELHGTGPRKSGPFVAINCASIPDGLIEAELFGYVDGAFTGARRGGAIGKFEQANGGTLFLDEIGDMPPSLQARLLRVLQERSVTRVGGAKDQVIDISLVCATHHDLCRLISVGKFREDLYYRVDGMCVTLPPLRERADIGEIIHGTVQLESDGSEHPALSDRAFESLKEFSWPGNIRQMGHVIRRAIALAGPGERIRSMHLPEEVRRAQPDAVKQGSASLERAEQEAVRSALRECSGNITAAARILGVGRPTLYRKMRTYNIARDGERS